MSSPRLVGSVSQELFDRVSDLATLEQRSLSQMVALLIQRGLAVYEASPASEAPVDMPAQNHRRAKA